MALSPQQRALLQLVLARGQSYSDIASLLGGDEDSVRERARAALRELAGADPDAEAPLTDYLLGQADPIDRADAVRALQRSPEARDLAEGLVAQLRLVVPDAELPELPAAPARPAGRPSAPGRPSAAPARGPAGGWRSMPDSRKRTLIALVAGAALAIAVTIVVVARDSDDDGGGTTTASAQNELARLERSFRDPIRLRRVDEGPEGATGTVALGTIENEFGMTIEARGLKPSEGDEYYVPWLYNTRTEALPLADGRKANRNGRLSLVGLIRADLLPILTRFPSLDVSLETRRRPTRHGGRSVLRGRIPGGGQGLSAETPPAGTATTPTTGG